MSLSYPPKKLPDFGPNVQDKLSFSNLNSIYMNDDDKSGISSSSQKNNNASIKHINRSLLLNENGQDYWTDLTVYYPDERAE
jgi:hypothetical protein